MSEAMENLKKETKDVQANVQMSVSENLGTAIVDGTKIEISSNGNIVVYTDRNVLKKAAPAPTTAARENHYFYIGKNFNGVAMYGARVSLLANGELIVYTDGTVKIKPPVASDATLEVGMKMPDGTIFAGYSPDTGKAMYAAPTDAGLKMNFDKAAKYAENLTIGGKKGFRIPSQDELTVLCQNRDKGAMKGTFNLISMDPSDWYWSSTPHTFPLGLAAWAQRFRDETQHNDFKSARKNVRCIRS